MKFFILFSLFTVLCIGQIRAAADESEDDIEEPERDPKSFYGFRRFPFQRRRLIPSRFYPNLFYSPVYIPRIRGLRRVYRSEPELDEDIHDELEKRSIERKMALMPKWKADIIRNLFGKGNRFKPTATLAKSAAAIQEELVELPFHGSDIFGGHHRSLEVDEVLDEIPKETQDKISENIEDVNDEESVVVDDISVIEEEIVNEERRRRNSGEGEMEEEEDQTELMDWPMKSRRRRRSSDDLEEQEEMGTQPEKRSAHPFLFSKEEEDVDSEEEMGDERMRRNNLEEVDPEEEMGDERMRRNILEEEEVDPEVESVYMGDERMRRNIMDEEEVDPEVESVYMGNGRMRRNIMEEEEVDPEVESVYMGDERMRRDSMDEKDMTEDDFVSMVEEVEDSGEDDSAPQKRSTYFSGGTRSQGARAAPYSRRSASQPRKDISSSLRGSLPRRSESSYSSNPRSIPSRPRNSGGSFSSSSSDSLPTAPVDNLPFRSDERALPRDGYSGNVRSRRNVMMSEESEPSDEETISMIDESEEEVDPFVRRYL